jgi:alpha-L-fucosidase 2
MPSHSSTPKHVKIAALIALIPFCTALLRAEIGSSPIWYREPAATWTEALPIGNGLLGAMVWGGTALERLDLNEATLWSGEPYDNLNPRGLAALPEIRRLLLAGDDKAAQRLIERDMNGKNNQCYLPLGNLQIAFSLTGEITDYRRELDLETGVVRVEFLHNGVRHTREIFASYPARAIVIRLSADQPAQLSFSATLHSQLRTVQSATLDALRLTGRAPIHVDPHYMRDPKIEYDESVDGKGMRFEARIVPQHVGGTISVTRDGLVAERCDSVTLLLTAATSYNGPHRSPSRDGKDPDAICEAALVALEGVPYPQMREVHVRDFQGLSQRVSLQLSDVDAPDTRPIGERISAQPPAGDPALAALYFRFGRYLLIASSRPGSQPANLQGIWNKDLHPAWSANWTINCNAQINYWPVEAANLAECHLPLIELTEQLSIDGANIAKNLYGARGWMAHHNTDIWRQAGPVSGSAQWTIFQVGSAWLCQHLWEHYAFNPDPGYLRRIWPTLRGAARFYLDALVEEPTHGWLVTAPDVNFEHKYRKADGTIGTVCAGPTGSMQMIRELFRNCVSASELLGVDAEFRAEIEKALPRLPPMQISPTTGELQEWLADWQRTADCMVMSSWGAICSAQITPAGTPELAAGLRRIFDNGSWWKTSKVGSWQGAFQANAYARLHDGDTALAVIDRHLREAVNPNLTSRFIGYSADFQIDGNLGITGAIAEMLLQSHASEIHLLPALPRAWPRGSVTGLRARGGLEVDIVWADGKLTAATIRRVTGSGAVQVRYGSTTTSLDLAAGQSTVFRPL